MDFLGSDELIDAEDFIKLLFRLCVNLGFAGIAVYVYWRSHKNRDNVFTYFVFNIVTFSLCFLLRKVPMELGFALGLFAVFGILRYRTEEIRIRDLTYLFIFIAIGILNAVANKKISFAELLLVNAAITGVAAMIELSPSGRKNGSLPMLYDNLPLLHPGKQAELVGDVAQRTGLDVVHVQVNRVDLLRDAAELTVFYRGAKP